MDFLLQIIDQPNLLIPTIVVICLSSILLFLSLSKPKIALNKDKWIDFKLIEKEVISHDVRRFRFALQSKHHKLGLPIGQHISFQFVNGDGKTVIRSYTPTTSDDEIGHVDFVIKVYFPLEPRFPKGGEMSQHLDRLKIGDTMQMKGPKGHLDYKGKGKFTIKKGTNPLQKYSMKKIGMVCGGTGITPMLQIIRAIMKDPEDKTEIWMIYANQTEDDILLRKELEALRSDRFKLYFTLDRPPASGWKYGSGFVNTEMCRQNLPSVGSDVMLWFCGPPPMLKFACEPAFKELGFDESQWFSF